MENVAFHPHDPTHALITVESIQRSIRDLKNDSPGADIASREDLFCVPYLFHRQEFSEGYVDEISGDIL
jgi:hypothetical protein